MKTITQVLLAALILGMLPAASRAQDSLISRMWGDVQYVHAWIKGSTAPPLVTSSPDGTPRAPAGDLPAATILYGGNEIGRQQKHGIRADGGIWFEQFKRLGVGVRFMTLDDDAHRFSGVSNPTTGSPIFARPYVDPITGTPDSILVSFPNELAGQIEISGSTEFVTYEPYLRWNVVRSDGVRLDLLGGYHYANLEDVLIQDQMTIAIANAGGIAQGTTFAFNDTFEVENEFHGGVVGLAAAVEEGPWSLNLLGKVAFGTIQQTATVRGTGVITTPAPNAGVNAVNGGLYAMPSNSGIFEQDSTSIAPEAAINIGYNLNDCWKLTVGYSFSYYTNMSRAAGLIDPNVNFSQVAPPLVVPPNGQIDPVMRFATEDFWIHGITVGLGLTY